MKCLFSIAFSFLLLSCHSSNGGGDAAEAPDFDIQIEGIPAGMRLYLIGTFADQQFKADSATAAEGGLLHFQREEPLPAGFYFIPLPKEQSVQLLLDKDQTFRMRTDLETPAGAMEVEGSLENELLYRNLKFEADYNTRYMDLRQKMLGLEEGAAAYQDLQRQLEALRQDREQHLDEIFKEYPASFFTQFKKAGQNPEPRDVRLPDGTVDKPLQVYLYRREFWDNVDFGDERLLRTPVINNKLERYMTEMTPQHADSIIGSTRFLVDKVLDHPEYFKFFTNRIALKYQPGKTKLMDGEAVFVYLVQEYLTYDRAFWADSAQVFALQQRAGEMEASLLGKTGPDVQAADPAGKLRSISEIKAPYVVVFMYNPDCDHCIQETPKLVRFYRKWKNEGVEVFAIALDTDDAAWKDFIARNQMDWINVFDPSNVSIYKKYYVDNTPEIYILNPERKIIGKNLNVSQIETVIQQDKEQG